MEDCDDGAAVLAQQAGQLEHLELVGDVEVRRRLVEQQQRRLLGKCHREPDPLALPARELVDAALGKVGDVGGPIAASTAVASSRDHCRSRLWCG